MSSNSTNKSITQSNISTSHRDDDDTGISHNDDTVISHRSNALISQDNNNSIQQKKTNNYGIKNNNNNDIKNGIKDDNESFASLRVLLQNEASPIYSCGRAYLLNLTKWCAQIDNNDRNKLLPTSAVENGDANQSKVVDGTGDTEEVVSADDKGDAVLDPMPADDKEEDASSDRGELAEPTLSKVVVGEKKAVVTLSEQPSNQHGSKEEDNKEDNKNNGDDDSSCHSRFSEGNDEDDKSNMPEEEASPDQNPTTLLEWRERVVSYFYEFADKKKWEHNTIINALSYLDTYCMSVCFPEQYAKIVRGRGREELPPQKKQKTQEEVSAIGCRQYKLAAITSLYLATKVYESGNPIICAKGHSNISKQYTAAEIEVMELDVLSAIGVQVNTPTSLRFIQELLPLLITRACDTKFSFDSMTWQPQDDIEKSIYLGANYFASLASICDASDNPLIVSSSPSQIALAAIVEATDRVFSNKKLLSQQHIFHQRLFSMAEIPYNKEVRDIQKVLVDLKRLNEQDDDSSVEEEDDDEKASPTSITDCKKTNVQSDSSNDKENSTVVVSTPSKKAPPASMNQSSSACKQKNSCPIWEHIESTADKPTQDEVLYLRG